MSSAYAVFEGGGVKGIALVGALARFQMEGVQFHGYAGSSAGAIVAALAAAGYPAVHARDDSLRRNRREFRRGLLARDSDIAEYIRVMRLKEESESYRETLRSETR